MTKLRYQTGCAGQSQAHGEAAPEFEGGRVVVGFNNGNVNNNDNNRAFARAVRVSGEYQGTNRTLFEQLYRAYLAARRGKKPSFNKLAFEAKWADRLLDLEQQIDSGTWEPSPYTAFVATRPKAREIYAPDFTDRVLHTWAVERVEPPFERIFIHDSFGNRRGKGSHAAVRRASQFMRQVHSGQGGGFYLQLDISNFFYSISREILWGMLKPAMQHSGVDIRVQQVMHALLRRSACDHGVRHRSSAVQRALVPRHKQLQHAARGCGLPIGNLPSQFLANVYMNVFDQFVKHTLKAKRYIRYVDDFVLFHQDKNQLQRWLIEIEAFLAERLRLRLKDDIRLRPMTDGLDFLGYIIHPTHTTVRKRVVSHAKEAITAWEREHVQSRRIRATPAELRVVQAQLASYMGHLRHANSIRLAAKLHRRFPWLETAARRRRFSLQAERRTHSIPWRPAKEQV